VKSLGYQVISFIETFLVHGPGDIEGEPILLDDEFSRFIVKSYEVDATGKKAIRRSVCSRPKGRAKSELAAMICLAEALGPVRFDHWATAGELSSWGYPYETGEPVGAPVKRPEILCFATELDQAGNTYDAIIYMCNESKRLAETYPGIQPGYARTLLPNGGVIRPETAAASSADGAKNTFAVFDETHLWIGPKLKRLHQVVLRNSLKRKIAQPWALETTTMFSPGEGSVAEGTFEYAQAVSEGRTKDLRLYFDHVQADAKWDVSKRRDRISGLKQVYGPAAGWMDLEAICDSFDDPQVSSSEFQRYWLNRPVTIQEAWLPDVAWTECHNAREIPDHVNVVLALDGSFSNDSTALIAVQVGEFPHIAVAGVWEKPPGQVGWTVPILDVEERIRACAERWRVVEVTADTHLWARSLEVLESEGLPVVAFPQSAARMTPATQRFTQMVLERQLTHDGNPALNRHVSNAVLKSDSRGTRIYKENKSSSRKIDLAVAAIMGLERAMQFEDAPAAVVPQFY
jgi:phage terminase large subunit-like protein